MSAAARRLDGKWIGISVSEPSEVGVHGGKRHAKESARPAAGVGIEHVREAIVRLTRTLLRAGANLAYGGDLRPDGFTRVLFAVARDEAQRSDVKWTQRLAGYLAWPADETLTRDERARLIHLSRMVTIRPAGLDKLGVLPAALAPHERQHWAGISLATMRAAMQRGGRKDDDGDVMPPLDARVVVGGKLTGYSGFMPGILEEAALALEAEVPLFVFGGFGGAAGLLGRLLAGEAGAEEFVHRRRDELKQRAIPESDAFPPPADLLGRLLKVAQKKRPWRALRTGLGEAEVQRMCTTRDVSAICRIARDGLAAALDRDGGP